MTNNFLCQKKKKNKKKELQPIFSQFPGGYCPTGRLDRFMFYTANKLFKTDFPVPK